MRRMPFLGILMAFALFGAKLFLRADSPDDKGVPSPNPGSTAVRPSLPDADSHARGRSHRLFDPIVLVTAVAAIASGAFAYQTNQINKAQSQLLDRQVAIEETLALPIFTLTWEVERDSGPMPTTKWVSLENSGGLANDLVISILPFVNFWWLEEMTSGSGDNTAVFDTTYGDALPLGGYIDDHAGLLPSRMYTNDQVRLGYEGNATQHHETIVRIADHLSRTHEISDVQHSFEIIAWLSYIDYMGTERDEYYFLSVNSEGEPVPSASFLRINDEFASDPLNEYYDKHLTRFTIDMYRDAERPGDELIGDLADRIYENRFLINDEQATPVAYRHGRGTREHFQG